MLQNENGVLISTGNCTKVSVSWKGQRSQSAMEYLMTYGWTILVIAIVLVALFELGVFRGSQGSLPTECTAQSGFLCGTPQMNTTGNVLVTFGQSLGSSITVTGVGCSNTTAQPGFTSYITGLASGQQVSVIFQCPLASSPIGSSFSGTLWIQYNKGSVSGLVSEVATFTARAATVNSVGSSSGGGTEAYVPITLSNQQSSGTGTNFQQLIYFNPSAYSSYAYSNMSNIEFTTGGPAGVLGSVPLYAWIESGASSTASNTVVWVNLGSSTLSAEGGGSNTLTVYMNFLSSNSPVTAGYTGYAPELWCASLCFQTSYANYDNGASVFSFYDNFEGTTLKSAWGSIQYASGSGVTTTVNNGLTLSSSTNQGWGYYTNSQSIPTGGLVEAYVSTSSEGYSPGSEVLIGSLTTTQGDGFAARTISGSDNYGIWNGEGFSYANSYSGSYTSGSEVILGGLDTNQPTLYSNYNSVYTLSDVGSGAHAGGFVVALGADGQATFQWVRARVYPPGGVMPSMSFGSIV